MSALFQHTSRLPPPDEAPKRASRGRSVFAAVCYRDGHVLFWCAHPEADSRAWARSPCLRPFRVDCESPRIERFPRVKSRATRVSTGCWGRSMVRHGKRLDTASSAPRAAAIARRSNHFRHIFTSRTSTPTRRLWTDNGISAATSDGSNSSGVADIGDTPRHRSLGYCDRDYPREATSPPTLKRPSPLRARWISAPPRGPPSIHPTVPGD